MAEIRVLGDMIQLKTDITEEALRKVNLYDESALKLKDEDGKDYFAVGLGSASVSKFGVCFCSVDFDGKLYMTTSNPTTSTHENMEAERQTILEEYAPIIRDLRKVEAQVVSLLREANALENDVNGAISFITDETVETIELVEG